MGTDEGNRREFLRRSAAATLALRLGAANLDSLFGGEARTLHDLAGSWRFALDPDDIGTTKRWFGARLPDTIALPRTTDIAGKGRVTDLPACRHLVRAHRYIGAACR